MIKVPAGIISFIDRHDCFYLLGHKEPDGDCVGSQLALASYLKSQGKRVHLLSSGPFSRTELAGYQMRFKSEAPPERAFERTAALVLDCSTMGRLGDVSATMPSVPVAFIDHHVSSTPPGEFDYIDPSAPSVTTLVFLLLEALGHRISVEEAELLLFGLCTDTGFFRHLDETGGEVMRIAARLVDAGASPKKIFVQINGGKPLLSRKLMGDILSRTEAFYAGQLLVCTISTEDQRRYGMANRDSDMLYQLLMGVSGVEVAMIVRQDSDSECTVGFRSRERINVAAVAERFGGGGHRLAAGLSIHGLVPDVKEKLVQAFASVFE